MTTWTSLLFVLTVTTPVLAQSKAIITGPQRIDTGSLVVLDYSASKADIHKWIVPHNLRDKTLEMGSKLIFATGVPGAYEFGLVVGDKEPTVDYTTWTVVVGDNSKPPVPPGPGPDPQPEPVVFEKGSWVVIVEETDDRYKFPHLSTLQANAAWNKRVKDKGLEVGWYDKDATEVKPWRSEAEKAGLPALLVISPTGKVIKSKTVPPTDVLVDEFLFGGAK